MDAASKRTVRSRADKRCEYCQLPQQQSPLARLQIEHIRPIKHQGSDELENLALACIDCNLHKGANVAGFDPETGLLTPLFDPRRENWETHFEWSGVLIVGRLELRSIAGK